MSKKIIAELNDEYTKLLGSLQSLLNSPGDSSLDEQIIIIRRMKVLSGQLIELDTEQRRFWETMNEADEVNFEVASKTKEIQKEINTDKVAIEIVDGGCALGVWFVIIVLIIITLISSCLS